MTTRADSVAFLARRPAERQSRTEQWRLALDGLDKLRLEPLIAQLVERHRGAYTNPEFLRSIAIKHALMAGIMGDRFEDVYDDLGALLGRTTPAGHAAATPAPATPSGVADPLRERPDRHAAVSDGAARDLLGARRWGTR